MNQRKAGALLSYVYLALTFLIGIFYTPILLDILGESEYGVYSVASSAIAFLAVLDLGFSQTMIRYVAKCKALNDIEGEKKLNGMFLTLYLMIAAIALIAGIILFANLEFVFQKGFTAEETSKLSIIFFILLINLIVSFPLGIYNSIISANEGFIFLKLVTIISSILTHAGILVALFMGYKSITMALITTIVSIFLKILTALYGTNKYQIRFIFHGFDKKILKEICVFSFYVFLNIVIDQLYANTDKIILGALCSSAAVTVYTVGVQFYSYFEQFSTSISGVFLPKVTKLVALNDSMKDISELFIRIGRIQFILLGFLMGGFVLLGKEFIRLWVGQEYIMSYYIALVVITPALIPFSQNIGISVLRAMNKHKFRSIIYFFIALANVVLSIPLALCFGGIGAAMATCFATCCGQILIMNWFYYKKIGLDIPKYWKTIVPILLKIALICCIGYGIIELLNLAGISSIFYSSLNGWLMLVCKGIVYIVTFVACAWRMILNSYEKSLVKEILRKRKRQ